MKKPFLKISGFLAVAYFGACACQGCDNHTDGGLKDADALTGSEVSPEMLWKQINAGRFTFGSSEKENALCRAPNMEKEVPVTLTRAFLMAATELTQAQWTALDLPNPSQEPKVPDKPVTFVNFYDTLVWCNKLSLFEGLETCYDLSSCRNPVGTGCAPDEKWAEEGCWNEKRNFNCTGEIHKYKDWYACPGYRLPTSAEWEYAAKAGVTETRTYGGDLLVEDLGDCHEQPALEDIAWYCNNSDDQIHEVGQKLPNPWGLYDTLGNVHEWTDYFSDGQPLDWDRPMNH